MTKMRFLYPVLTVFIVLVTVILAWQAFRLGLFGTGQPTIISNHNIVLEKIEELGKLELVKYKFKDVLEYNIKYDWWPDSKAVLIVSGEAVGCIDLKKVRKEDIRDSKDTVYIRLPQPELCYHKINHQETRLYDTKSYSFDQSKMVSEAYKVAEKQIEKTALESNILEQTQQNGERLLKPLFEQLSSKKVAFSYQPKIEEKDKIDKK